MFNVYWKLQEFGKARLNAEEKLLVEGEDGGAATWETKRIAEGKKLVNLYGVKTQQLADCSVCHY